MVLVEHLLALAREVALGVVLAQVDGEVGDTAGVVLVAGEGRGTEGVADPMGAGERGRAGRCRVIEHFSWRTIAEQTVDLYRSLV